MGSNQRSSLTRSRLKKLKRLLLLTWPNSAKLKPNLEMLLKVLTSMNKLWPKLRLVAVLDQLDPCKRTRNAKRQKLKSTASGPALYQIHEHRYLHHYFNFHVSMSLGLVG